MTLEIKNKIKELREKLSHHDHLYFVLEQPEILDKEYDVLYQELKELEKQFPEYITDSSTTQKVSGKVSETLPTVKHPFPMLSLDKNKFDDIEGLYKFLNKWKNDGSDINGYNTKRFSVQTKEDGLTVANYYNQLGHSFVSVTRGDGVNGEDITSSIRKLPTVPQKLYSKDGVEVTEAVGIRGEAVLDYIDFDRVNTDGKYSSPRNLVSGSIRTNDTNIAKERNVRFKAYNIENPLSLGIETEEEMFDTLKEWGFTIVDTYFFDNTEEGKKELVEFVTSYEDKYRKSLSSMIDGLVIKADDLKSRELVGQTSHHPRWALAYKFESEDAITTVKDIYWSVGKTGILSPNALVEPVEISESIIERASLANINNIKERDIRVGDTVVIIRSNDVIPQIISSIKSKRLEDSVEVELPTHCPYCNTEVEIKRTIDARDKNKELLVPYCVNKNCETKHIRILENFASKPAMNIDSLGGKTLEAIYEVGLLYNISDIYTLYEHEEKLLELDRFGKRKVEKLLKNIEDSKSKGLYSVLVGLGIQNIGKDVSKKLCINFNSYENLQNTFKNIDEFDRILDSIEGFGSVIKDTIKKTLSDTDFINTMEELDNLGVLLENTLEEVDTSTIDKDSPIFGKTFVITGDLSMPRTKIKALIEEKGGIVTGSVSKKTDYLLFGGDNKSSSKYKKAISLGTEIVGEDFISK